MVRAAAIDTPVLSFRPGVTLVESDAASALDSPWGQLPIKTITPGLRAVIEALSSGGGTEDDLSRLMFEGDGAPALASFFHHLERWQQCGLVAYTVAGPAGPLVTVVPIHSSFRLHARTLDAGTRLRMSRFAYCRRDSDALVLESPLSAARAILSAPVGLAAIATLAQPRTVGELCRVVSDLAPDRAEIFLCLLWSADFLGEVGEDETLAEERNQTLAQWEFHDLLFHGRSRHGRHDHPFGGTYRFRGVIPSLRALKPKMSDDIVALVKPDIRQLDREDVPFTRVLERRKSIREYGAPITAAQLAEFLYRAARVRLVVEANEKRGLLYETSSRPYPSGGGTYDLEIYLTVNSCDGIRPGIYHYDPMQHVLERIAERTRHADALLSMARFSAALQSEPQVLITLASRFQRLSWKYASMAYATTLKNVGVLYQTMYLVATAMGLAPCALGGGNARLFAEAVGTDYLAESSVGEFLLGTQKT